MTTKTTNILLVLNLLFLGGILIRQSFASQSFAMRNLQHNLRLGITRN